VLAISPEEDEDNFDVDRNIMRQMKMSKADFIMA
jgi:hypothetical protein